MKKNNDKTTSFSLLSFIISHKIQIILLILFLLHISLRFFQLYERANLGWDQVDSAWAAKKILVDHQILINGPVAKGNTGIYMGPIYFWAISIFYFFTNLDPIASPIFQGVLSIINLVVLLIVTKKLFGTNVALIAGFINTFSLAVMNADRGQSGYYLIVLISYLIFYALFKVITGSERHIPLLAFFTGLSFHIDFTSVFYPILILCALPFFPKRRSTLKYIVLSLPIFFVFFIPTAVVNMRTSHSTSGSFLSLFSSYYHGFHVQRFFQIIFDGFSSFEQVLQFKFLRSAGFFVVPVFAALYYKKESKYEWLRFLFLTALWIVVPWGILSTYSGELTQYYFSLPQDIVIAMLAFVTYFLLKQKYIALRIVICLFWIIYGIQSVHIFYNGATGNLLPMEKMIHQKVERGEHVEFSDGAPEPYLYYVYTTRK